MDWSNRVTAMVCPECDVPSKVAPGTAIDSNPDLFPSHAAFIDHLASNLGLNDVDHAINIHAPGGCADTFVLKQLQRGGNVYALPLYQIDPQISLCVHLTPEPSENSPSPPVSPKKEESQKPVDDAAARVSSQQFDGHYVRIGRILQDDDKEGDEDIPTKEIAVGRIPASVVRADILAVPTWILNGIRIGDCEGMGDLVSGEELLRSNALKPDPFYVARDADSPDDIRRLLRERVKAGLFDVNRETLSEQIIDRKCQVAAYGYTRIKTEDDDDEDDAQSAQRLQHAGEIVDVKDLFRNPWCLPTKPLPSPNEYAYEYEVTWNSQPNLETIDVVAVYVNEITNQGLNLPQYVQLDISPNDSLVEVKRHFTEAIQKEKATMEILKKERGGWQVKIWVLPQVNKCSTLYDWDLIRNLRAKGFCHPDSVGDGEKGKLYFEAHIVPADQ